MEIVEDVRSDLIDSAKYHQRVVSDMFSTYIDELTSAGNVDNIMRAKKRFTIRYLEEIPVGIRYCYFCILHNFESEGTDACQICEYGKHHGWCIDDNSKYMDFIRMSDNASDYCERHYYIDGEFEDL